jgi:hypothetical protein
MSVTENTPATSKRSRAFNSPTIYDIAKLAAVHGVPRVEQTRSNQL